MKKIIYSLWLVIYGLWILLVAAPTLANAASLSLSPSQGTFNQGCTFQLQVLVDTGGVQTAGTDAIIFFDPTKFRVQKITSGTIYPDYPGNNFDNQNGKITISGLSSVTSSFAGSGVLATIDFSVLEATASTGATQIRFDFDPNDRSKTTDSNVVESGTISDVLNQVIDGTYIVGTGSCSGQGGPMATVTAYPTKTLDYTGVKPGFPLPTILLGATGIILMIVGILGLALL